MKPRLLILALGLAYASHASTTFAQAFLNDRRLMEGRGVKAGDFELHPGIAAEGGYDSNYFQTSGVRSGTTGVPTVGAENGCANCPPRASVNEPVIDSYRLRITPSLSFASRGVCTLEEGGGAPPRLILSGRLSASYNALFAADSAYSSQVSNQDDVAANAGLNLNIFPVGTFGGDALVDYSRVIEASNDPDLRNAFKRDVIRGGGGIAWRPGGGLFTWRVGYLATATLFESGDFTNLDNIKHTLQLSGSWKFLPRTALLYRGNITWLRYTSKNQPATLGDGEIMDSQIGINGLISNYFGLLGMIGWNGTFYEPRAGAPQNADSVIGQAQVTWYPMPQRKVPAGEAPVGLSSVALGYTRNFGTSYLGTYFQRDRGYLNMAYFFAQHFVLSLAGGFSHITRPATFFADGTEQAPDSGENRIDATAFLEYRVTSTVGINTTFRYDGELEHKVYPLGPAGTPPPGGDDLKFDRYQAYLGVRWFL
jgi:hypothetical protein